MLGCAIDSTPAITQPTGHDTLPKTAATSNKIQGSGEGTCKFTLGNQRDSSAEAALGTKGHCRKQSLGVGHVRSSGPGERQGGLVKPDRSDWTRNESMLQSQDKYKQSDSREIREMPELPKAKRGHKSEVGYQAITLAAKSASITTLTTNIRPNVVLQALVAGFAFAFV